MIRSSSRDVARLGHPLDALLGAERRRRRRRGLRLGDVEDFVVAHAVEIDGRLGFGIDGSATRLGGSRGFASASLKRSPCACSASSSFCVFGFGPRVEGADVAHAGLGENGVALLHLIDRPAQREQHLFRIGDDRDDEMRQRVVDLHLDDLRIDHDEAQILRREPVEDAGDDRVDADAFARAGGAGDEPVRHRGEIGDDRLAVDVLAERDRDFRLGRCGSRRSPAARAA